MLNTEPRILVDDPNADESVDVDVGDLSVAGLVDDLAASGKTERRFSAAEVSDIVERRLRQARKIFERQLQEAIETVAEQAATRALVATGAVQMTNTEEEE